MLFSLLELCDIICCCFATVNEMVVGLKTAYIWMEKSFTRYSSNSGSRICKEFKTFKHQRTHDVFSKWASEMNKYFSKN